MLQYEDSPVTLKLTKAQFLVIYELLYNMKLGDSNLFEEAVSDLMIDMEGFGAEELVNDFKDELGEPSLGLFIDGESSILCLSVDEK